MFRKAVCLLSLGSRLLSEPSGCLSPPSLALQNADRLWNLVSDLPLPHHLKPPLLLFARASSSSGHHQLGLKSGLSSCTPPQKREYSRSLGQSSAPTVSKLCCWPGLPTSKQKLSFPPQALSPPGLQDHQSHQQVARLNRGLPSTRYRIGRDEPQCLSDKEIKT